VTPAPKGNCPSCTRKKVALKLARDGRQVCSSCAAAQLAGAATFTAMMRALTPAGNVGAWQFRHGLTFAEAAGVVGSALSAGKACEAWLYRDDIDWPHKPQIGQTAEYRPAPKEAKAT
jgi:hypothetical protein